MALSQNGSFQGKGSGQFLGVFLSRNYLHVIKHCEDITVLFATSCTYTWEGYYQTCTIRIKLSHFSVLGILDWACTIVSARQGGAAWRLRALLSLISM